MYNSLFIDTLTGRQSTLLHRPPIWFMRQAGRALSSYRSLKEKYTFQELLRDPELASEVTLLPKYALGIDALILFSDILVIPEAMGIEVNYEQGSPKMNSPLKTTGGKLPKSTSSKIINSNILESVYQTITAVRKREKELPLIGFCGGPLTIFLYLYQGSGHGGNFDEAIDFFYNEPKKTDWILEVITEASLEYARGQIKHGVDAFQVFETWANVISAPTYITRVLPYVLRLAMEIKKSIPLIYFPRFFSNGYELLSPHLEHFSGIGVDYLMDIEKLSRSLPSETVLQGNIDPTLVKYSHPGVLKKYLGFYLNFFKKHRNWIVNLGHGVLPGTPESNLKLIVDTVKSLSPNYS